MFSGGIVDNGRIAAAPGRQGILVNSSGDISGGIKVSSKGTISAQSAIVVENITTFAGGITNSGAISGRTHGITVASLTEFTGGITNNGTVSAVGGSHNIFVGSMSIFSGGIVNAAGGVVGGSGGPAIAASNVAIFNGGITNRGDGWCRRKCEVGINVQFGGTFAGAIINTGMISGLRGIGFLGGNVLGDLVTGGGIVNSGTISASGTGVSLDHVNTIFGGVSNSGKILAAIGVVVRTARSHRRCQRRRWNKQQRHDYRIYRRYFDANGARYFRRYQQRWRDHRANWHRHFTKHC